MRAHLNWSIACVNNFNLDSFFARVKFDFSLYWNNFSAKRTGVPVSPKVERIWFSIYR